MTSGTTTDQARNILGQWGHRLHPEPAEDLLVEPVDVTALSHTDALENAQGSFFAPALPRTADQLVSFWSDVPVPEDVVLAFQEAYRRVNVANSARKIRAGKAPPTSVHAGEARYLIRAVRLVEEANSLPESERTRALRHPMPYPGGSGKGLPAPVIVETFRLRRLGPAWKDGYSGTYA